jgi:putative transcriptional regulator
MTTITHHPDDATLMSFAAGSLTEALAGVVAAHLDLCPSCRRAVKTMQSIGAALFDALPAAGMDRGAPIMAARRMEADAQSANLRRLASSEVPPSLARVMPFDLDQVPWRRLSIGVWHHRLPSTAGDLRLLKVGAGRRMPEHGHGGTELTLMLRGSYTDETGTYRPGDIADLDDNVEHTPVADAVTGCICLIASEKPARFKGLIPRIVQPLTGM